MTRRLERTDHEEDCDHHPDDEVQTDRLSELGREGTVPKRVSLRNAEGCRMLLSVDHCSGVRAPKCRLTGQIERSVGHVKGSIGTKYRGTKGVAADNLDETGDPLSDSAVKHEHRDHDIRRLHPASCCFDASAGHQRFTVGHDDLILTVESQKAGEEKTSPERGQAL